MITADVRADLRRAMIGLSQLEREQVPFATALALNEAAKDAQAEIRRGIQDRFTVRRPWVLQGVKINPQDRATKRKLWVRVHLDRQRDFLEKFESGGTKRPRSGRSIAIAEDARPTKAAIPPKSLRPRTLRFGPEAPTARGGAMIARGRGKTVLIRRPDGRGVIVQGARTRGKNPRARRVLWLLKPQGRIDARLRFAATGRQAALRAFPQHWPAAFARAMATAR